MKKTRTTAIERKLSSLQKRIDRTKELADFLMKHPHLAEIGDLKAGSNGLMGLVIDDRAFVRPLGLNKPGLRIEKWPEDTFTDMELKERMVCEDASQLTSEQLEDLLATVPDPYDQEHEDDDKSE
jgi:hypothetical protein